MKIWLRVHTFQRCSWSIVYNYLKRAFSDIGIELSEDPFNFPKGWDQGEYIELWWGDPRFWTWDKKEPAIRIGLTLSEANSLLADGRDIAIANLRRCDAIICPSQHATIAFREAPLNIPIYVVPFGVDTSEYHYTCRNWDSIGFLHIGNTQFRKGSWMVPEAFCNALGKQEDAYLTIACFMGRNEMFSKLEDEYGGHPRIRFISEAKKTAMELYASHHVLVSPHLSEGFGLCIPEAMATGMCCLVSRCTAPLDYFSHKYGYWIEMSEVYAPVSNCLPNTGGLWRVPDIKSLKAGMKEVYNKRQEAQYKGMIASKTILENMTWHDTVRQLSGLMERLIGGIQ